MSVEARLPIQTRRKTMGTHIIELANTVCRDPNDGAKIYLDQVAFMVRQLPFATRQVLLRFSEGPELDLALIDMDRIAIEYLKMRGVTLPPEASELANATPPPKGDFVVPRSLMSELSTGSDSKPGEEPLDLRHCARCGETHRYCGDWYGDLCPSCADATEPDYEDP
jgi:hypothetical protein